MRISTPPPELLLSQDGSSIVFIMSETLGIVNTVDYSIRTAEFQTNISRLALSPNGQWLLVLKEDSVFSFSFYVLEVYDTAQLVLLHTYTTTDYLYHLTINNAGHIVAVSGENRLLILHCTPNALILKKEISFDLSISSGYVTLHHNQPSFLLRSNGRSENDWKGLQLIHLDVANFQLKSKALLAYPKDIDDYKLSWIDVKDKYLTCVVDQQLSFFDDSLNLVQKSKFILPKDSTMIVSVNGKYILCVNYIKGQDNSSTRELILIDVVNNTDTVVGKHAVPSFSDCYYSVNNEGAVKTIVFNERYNIIFRCWERYANLYNVINLTPHSDYYFSLLQAVQKFNSSPT